MKKATDWFNVEAWGKLGEICQSFLHKGRLVFLEGSLRTSHYEVEGETRYVTKVVASQMQMLDRKEEKGDGVVGTPEVGEEEVPAEE